VFHRSIVFPRERDESLELGFLIGSQEAWSEGGDKKHRPKGKTNGHVNISDEFPHPGIA
jgi:hypothetical protein